MLQYLVNFDNLLIGPTFSFDEELGRAAPDENPLQTSSQTKPPSSVPREPTMCILFMAIGGKTDRFVLHCAAKPVNESAF